jgi:hypothetical protein
VRIPDGPLVASTRVVFDRPDEGVVVGVEAATDAGPRVSALAATFAAWRRPRRLGFRRPADHAIGRPAAVSVSAPTGHARSSCDSSNNVS